MNIPIPIVPNSWLRDHLHDTDLVILDASLPKPMTKAEDNPLAEIQIPNARFFDIDNNFSDPSYDLPHMMPAVDDFTLEAQKLGINKTGKIVVYDNLGVYSSPRVWWMLKAMGHDQITVLDGGLPAWIAAGLPTELKQQQAPVQGNFEAKPQAGFFKNSKDILNTIADEATLIFDARSNGRFKGTEPEPRAGLRSGHIPSSKNIPFSQVLDNGQLLEEDALIQLFSSQGVSNQELIFSCGSGLTACILTLAASVAGLEKLSVYDGSWSEWGQPGQLPIATGD